MHGTARYASTCSWLFHWYVATRSPGRIPSACRALASRAALRPTSAYEALRSPSPVAVTTSLVPWNVRP